jgi:hypothetical protein
MTTQAEETEIRPFAPYWLPQQQRQHLDRILNKLVERGACSICGNEWKSNSHTAYGLDSSGKVVVAGKCCIDKITTAMGYGFFGRCDFPGSPTEHGRTGSSHQNERESSADHDAYNHSVHEHVRAHSAREWKIKDWAWFGKNPTRSHRALLPFAGEDSLFIRKAPPGCAPIVLVRQVRPGTWLRLGFGLGADMVPPPDDEALIHAMFEIAARREPVPVTMQAFCALRDKYAVRSSC